MSRFALLIGFCLLSVVFGFGRYVQHRNYYNQKIYVDCTNGNDGTGDGSSANPYLTINQAQQTVIQSALLKIIIRNGPCTEPQITTVVGFSYWGDGSSSPVVITNGIQYQGVGYEWTDIVYSNLELGSLDINMSTSNQAGTGVGPSHWFYNCKIDGGSCVGSANTGFGACFFVGSIATLSLLGGGSGTYDSNISLSAIDAGSNIFFDGGTLTGSISVGDAAGVSFVQGSTSTASLTCTGTGLNKPLVDVTKTTTMPTITGCDTNHLGDDTKEQGNLRGTVAIGLSGNVTVTIPAVYGPYNVELTPTGTTSIVGYVDTETSTSFVVHGLASSTYAWLLTKQ